MLKLSRLADYATLLMCRMTQDAEAAQSAAQLAQALGLPLPTVAKLLKRLTRAQLLYSERGGKGGYRLARSAASITLVDVISAVDGPLALTQCVSAPGSCAIELSCETRDHWTAINRAVNGVLSGVSLAQLGSASAIVIKPPGREGARHKEMKHG
jgi:FeS assembly SUF system regulator